MLVGFDVEFTAQPVFFAEFFKRSLKSEPFVLIGLFLTRGLYCCAWYIRVRQIHCGQFPGHSKYIADISRDESGIQSNAAITADVPPYGS